MDGTVLLMLLMGFFLQNEQLLSYILYTKKKWLWELGDTVVKNMAALLSDQGLSANYLASSETTVWGKT